MERSPELEQVVRDFFRNAAGKDRERVLAEAFSHHECLSAFGTDPDEHWRGYKEILGTWIAQQSERPEPAWTIEEIRAWTERGIGWVEMKNVSASQGRPVVPMRSTLIYRLEQGTWKIIHIHVSAGITNEALWGYTLTTSIDQITVAWDREDTVVHPVAGEDGTVTILFTDIEDSTLLNERLGDGRWMELLRDHNAIVRRHVAAENGLEVKHQGDGFMLAFADPAAAVRSAVTIQRSFSTRTEGEIIRVRIGGHVGTTVVERDDFFGRTVVLASRIAGAARGGEILVSDALHEKIWGDEFAFGKPLQLPLKGLAGEHTVHRIEWGRP